MTKRLLYPLGNLTRRVIRFMREYWKQILLIAIPLVLVSFATQMSNVWVGTEKLPTGERILIGILVSAITALVLIAVFLALWWFHKQDEIEKNRQNTELNDLTKEIRRLIQRMDDREGD